MVGGIVIYRQEVRPFTDKQIALVQNFAGVLVLLGRAYIFDGFQLTTVYDDSFWIFMHASIRAACALIVKRFAGPF